MDINSLLLGVIEDKYNQLQAYKAQSGIFEKIASFEGNAIGQVGERFVKLVFKNLNIKMRNFGDVIHDEFDICLENGTKIEIKTARKGLKNNSFQFNGINPHYNCDYIICIGLSVEAAYFRIINGEKIYNHKTRKFYLKIDDKERQLVAMNPGNQANYKLTLQLKDLEQIEYFINAIRAVFG